VGRDREGGGTGRLWGGGETAGVVVWAAAAWDRLAPGTVPYDPPGPAPPPPEDGGRGLVVVQRKSYVLAHSDRDTRGGGGCPCGEAPEEGLAAEGLGLLAEEACEVLRQHRRRRLHVAVVSHLLREKEGTFWVVAGGRGMGRPMPSTNGHNKAGPNNIGHDTLLPGKERVGLIALP